MQRILIAWLFLIPAWPLAQSTIPAETRQKLDAVFSEYDRTNSPGCALGVIRDGNLVYQRGYGMANLEWGIANSSDTVFRIGSTSKQFAAAAIVFLAKQGKLSFDDEIQRFLPEIPRYSSPVTIRHMLHHTSGLRDYLVLAMLSGLRSDDYYTDAEVLEMLSRQREPNFPAGEEYLYSNSNYVLLAYIVERVSGKNLKDFAREQIFQPLGMKNSHFHNDHEHIVPRRATGYSRTADGFRINMTRLPMIGDGGVLTSVEDLLLWDRNFYQDRLGVAETLHSPTTLNNGEPIDYAFGLRVGSYRGLKTVRHGGAFVGFRADMVRFPEQRVSIVCLCNLSQTRPSDLADEVADIVLAESLQAREEEQEGETHVPPPDEPLPPDDWDAYEGTYEVEPGVIIEVTVEERKLFANATAQGKFELEPVARDNFRLAAVDALIQFERDDSGAVHRLTFHRGASSVPAPRVPGRALSGPDLQAYAGTYFSSELNADYSLESKEGKLLLKVGKRSPEPVTVREDASASSELGRFQFEKDSEGNVIGFVLQAGRVKNLRFQRRRP